MTRTSPFSISRWLLLPLAMACLSLAPANSQAAPARALSAADTADLHRIEGYLDSIHTLKAHFEQFNPDDSTASGDIYLSRPGKMRFDYAPPAQMDIVSNGDFVAVDDKELKQVNFLPVTSTPVWFLLREGIKLSGDVTVTKFDRADATLRVTAVQTKDPNSGSITLVFSDKPLQLIKWTILDAQGRTTTVALDDAQQGVSIDPDLFRLPNPPTKNVRAR